MAEKYAGVYILDAPYHIDHLYEYYIPAGLEDSVTSGSVVCVPFGGGNRKKLALVMGISVECACNPDKVKPILSAGGEQLRLDPDQMDLCLFLKEQTLCTVGEALHTMIPAAAFGRISEFIRALTPEHVQMNDPVSRSKSAGEPLTQNQFDILEFITGKQRLALSAVTDKFGQAAVRALNVLRERGLVVFEHEFNGPTNNKFINKYSLEITAEGADKLLGGSDESGGTKLRSQKQLAVIGALREFGPLIEDELIRISGATATQIRPLLGRGFINREKIEAYRDPLAERYYGNDGDTAPGEDFAADESAPADPLNAEQKNAFARLSDLLNTGEARAALLHGITGSGKTRVIKETVDRVLAEGRGVIILLPEIALTPQSLDYFCRYYRGRVAVIHSGLSAGERYDAYKRVKTGLADVVIGTRSAVFAPVRNLGLLVIDEEQEHTYKSDINPKYHAREVARFRCARAGALMLLASATPSLESYHKARAGAYELIEMKERFGGAVLPKIEICDMRGEAQSGNTSPLGERLAAALSEVIAAGKSAILFLNRRGFNNFLSCRSCGEAIRCAACSVAMTYHTHINTRSGYLSCHFCGDRQDPPAACPACGSRHVSYIGWGTQRLEGEIEAMIPGARPLRMDADATAAKFSHAKLLERFRNGEANILLGTQMIAKGHDFPGVMLVGVLSADASLYLDDYRASERTFAMLVQVAGRAGRSGEQGLAIIQTYNPDGDIINLACAQDYAGFYEREIKLRRSLVFPPFCDVALITVSSSDEGEAGTAARLIHGRLRELTSREFADVAHIMFGPFEAPVYRVNNRFRMRLVLKCKLKKRTRALFAAILTEFGKGAGGKASVSVDFNPSNL